MEVNNVSFTGFGVVQGTAKDLGILSIVFRAGGNVRHSDAVILQKGATEAEDLYLVATGERDCEILNKTKNTPEIYKAVTTWFNENLSKIIGNTEKYTNRDLPIISKAEEILEAGPSQFDYHNVEKINNKWFADYLLSGK